MNWPNRGRRPDFGSTAKNIRGTAKNMPTKNAAITMAKMEGDEPVVAIARVPISVTYEAAMSPPTAPGTSGAEGAARYGAVGHGRSSEGAAGACEITCSSVASSTGWRRSNVVGSYLIKDLSYPEWKLHCCWELEYSGRTTGR
jgi:hypothetical protein